MTERIDEIRPCTDDDFVALVDIKKTLQVHCAIQHARCHSGPIEDWFRLVLINDLTVLNFCPRHALAAEVLVEVGLSGKDIVAMLQKTEK